MNLAFLPKNTFGAEQF